MACLPAFPLPPVKMMRLPFGLALLAVVLAIVRWNVCDRCGDRMVRAMFKQVCRGSRRGAYMQKSGKGPFLRSEFSVRDLQ